MASMDIHTWDIGVADAPQSTILMLNGDALPLTPEKPILG